MITILYLHIIMAFIADIINNNNCVNIFVGRFSVYAYVGPKNIVHV